MNCRWTQRKISRYADGGLNFVEETIVREHLIRCATCMALYEEYDGIAAAIGWMKAPEEPPHLGTKIRSAISIEAARQAEPNWRWQRLKTRIDDLLRPLAVPAVGGVLSALVLVTALLSAVWMAPTVYADDIPVRFLTNHIYSPPVMKMPSPYPVDRDFTVLAYINVDGEVYDFEVAEEGGLDDHSRGQIGNALLMSEFQPAMSFGRPQRGKIVILFQSVHNL